MKKAKSILDFHLWTGSSPEDLIVFKQGVKALSKWPIKLHFSKTSVKNAITAESEARYYLAGSDQLRANNLAKLLRNPKTQEILCSRGGYGTLRLLPVLDKMRITPAGTKRIWGYSDTTVIQHYLYNRFGWSWVHSPMLTSHSLIDPTRQEKIELNRIFVHRMQAAPKKLKILNPGKLPRGHHKLLVLGGNLMSLVSMFGSKWEPRPRGRFLLFIEDIGEAPYRLDRLLQMLSFSKFYKNCVGILMGHFTSCPGYKDILQLWAKEQNIFLASKIDMGHNTPNIPHPMGGTISLRVRNKELAIIQFPNLGI